MFEGKSPIDLKRAVWLVENIGNKDAVSYDEYLLQIELIK